MTLSLQLKQMEKDGLISCQVHANKPPVKVVYELTALGKTTIPVLLAVNDWGRRLAAENGESLGSM